MIDQLTVFLENTPGRLTALCKALGDASINMSALTLADTTDYGIVRIICNDPVNAAKVLQAEGFRATTTKIVAVEVPDEPGGLAKMLHTLDAAALNIEYSYCFLDGTTGTATVALKTDEKAMEILEEAGYRVIHPTDLYKKTK